MIFEKEILENRKILLMNDTLLVETQVHFISSVLVL